MGKTIEQIEKDVQASFGYVKKDMLMINDAISDVHDKIQHLSMNHATLLDEVEKLRREISQSKPKKTIAKKIKTKAKKSKSVKKPKKVIKTEEITYS